jgi:hypothetical protein
MKSKIFLILLIITSFKSCSQTNIENERIIGTWLELRCDGWVLDTLAYKTFIWKDSLNYNNQQMILLKNGNATTKYEGEETYKTNFSMKNGYLIFNNLNDMNAPNITMYKILKLNDEYLILRSTEGRECYFKKIE